MTTGDNRIQTFITNEYKISDTDIASRLDSARNKHRMFNVYELPNAESLFATKNYVAFEDCKIEHSKWIQSSQ